MFPISHAPPQSRRIGCKHSESDRADRRPILAAGQIFRHRHMQITIVPDQLIDEIRSIHLPHSTVHPECNVHIFEWDFFCNDFILMNKEFIHGWRTPSVAGLNDFDIQRCMVFYAKQIVIAVVTDKILIGNTNIVWPVGNLHRIAAGHGPDAIRLA